MTILDSEKVRTISGFWAVGITSGGTVPPAVRYPAMSADMIALLFLTSWLFSSEDIIIRIILLCRQRYLSSILLQWLRMWNRVPLHEQRGQFPLRRFPHLCRFVNDGRLSIAAFTANFIMPFGRLY